MLGRLGPDQLQPHQGTRMAAYLVIEGEITDQAKWIEYRKAVVPLIARFGGRHLTGRGGAKLLEGARDDWIVAIFEFASMEAVQEFWDSPEYVPVKALRQVAAKLQIRAVPGA